jgi:hypothetical protein
VLRQNVIRVTKLGERDSRRAMFGLLIRVLRALLSLLAVRCACAKLNPNILMMQTAQQRQRREKPFRRAGQLSALADQIDMPEHVPSSFSFSGRRSV